MKIYQTQIGLYIKKYLEIDRNAASDLSYSIPQTGGELKRAGIQQQVLSSKLYSKSYD